MRRADPRPKRFSFVFISLLRLNEVRAAIPVPMIRYLALACFVLIPTLLSGADNHWAVEDPHQREQLPLYQIIPAARPDELTPANSFPKRETYLSWHRSHGDNGGTRYSALDQINRQNVTNLQVAWTYHSADGSNYIQCNPIIVRGVM